MGRNVCLISSVCLQWLGHIHSKSVSRFTDFSGRENLSINEDLDLKWEEFAMGCTEKSAFPSITTQRVKLINCYFKKPLVQDLCAHNVVKMNLLYLNRTAF